MKESISSRYWQYLGADPTLANALRLEALVANSPVLPRQRSKLVYLDSTRIHFTIRCSARVVDEVYAWEVVRDYQSFELLWTTLLSNGITLPPLPATFTDIDFLVDALSTWLAEVFRIWQGVPDTAVVSAEGARKFKEIARGLQRFCLYPESVSHTFSSLLKDVYLIVLRVLVVQCERRCFGSATSGLLDSSVSLEQSKLLRRRRLKSCPILRFHPVRVLRHQYRKQTVFNIKTPASSLARDKRGVLLAEVASKKDRRQSECSTFSCGVQRFRFTKLHSADELSNWSEEDLDSILSDEHEHEHVYQYGLELLKEDGYELDTCRGSNEKFHLDEIGFGTFLPEPDPTLARAAKAGEISPARIDVVQGSWPQEGEECWCWTPVSIPPSYEEKEEFDKQSLQYTVKTLEAAAQVLQCSR